MSGLGAARKAAPLRKSGPATSCGSRPVRSIGTGATSTTAMTHIAIAEKFSNGPVDWMEKVTDEQYLRKADARQPA